MTPTRNKAKERQRQEIERQTRDYLRRGGQIIVGGGQTECRPIGMVKTSMDIRRGNA